MAETAASALLSVIFKKLTDEALKKYARSQNIHSELDELHNTLGQLQALLNDASQKEVTERSVKKWLNDLQHLAYDIDDILDDVATEAMRRELTPESGAITNKVRNLIVPTCCTNFSLTHRLSPRLDLITKKLQNLEKQKGALGLTVKDGKHKDAIRGNETSLLESNIVGREGEKETLIKKLLGGESSNENFSILPIVGMGGVGKTTLARLVYNDERVIHHFQLKAWICVSDDFDIVKISDAIFQYVTIENKEENKEKHKEKKDLNQLQMVQMALREQFKEKRFLLVLDDVWTDKYEEWENLMRPFRHGAPGSRIIMTTRKEHLLKMIGFDHLDHLDSLSDTDALSLLALHALGVDNFDSHQELRAKGERVVEKCGCLPLALKAIGRLLRTKTHGEKWDDVLNSQIWDSKNVGDFSGEWKAIFPALMLSFHDLSADLKQLFAYCSLFPKDFLFNKEELVLLWMAEGFLNKSNATKSPECLGVEYFGELLSRSFFQQAPDDECLFVMHDLMNDLATYVSGEFYLRFDNDMDMGDNALAKYRHMSFIHEDYVTYHKFEAFRRAKSLRTLIAVFVEVDSTWQTSYISSKILVNLLPELELLRVLCLSYFNISEVPDFIGSLKHLRYLNLSRTNIKELPENVGNLYNLETLMLSGCKFLTKLPTSFLKLKRLRHFDIENTPQLKKLPLGIGELRSLQILPKIIIGGDGGLAIAELKGLSQKRLTKLELNWVDGSRRGPLENGVLDELEPSRDMLEELAIVSYGGTKFSNWVGDPSFQVLVNVSIRDCRKCTTLPPFGQLPSLKMLIIQGIDEVKFIGIEFTGSDVVAFRSLEVLMFEDMSCWEGWSTKTEGSAVFPCLQELLIKSCPKLVDVSLEDIPSLKVLHIDECGEGVLRSMILAASSIIDLNIRSILGLTYEVWRGVIVYLRAVEEVCIQRCNEIKYLWESEAEASKVLVKLKKLMVQECDKLVSLGEKEEDEDNLESSLRLSSFRILEVSFCKSIERCCCPNSVSIESLDVVACSSVTHISFPTTVAGEGGQNLKSLWILECEKVIEKINNTSMPMLESVYIREWKNLKSVTQLSNFTHLTTLLIYICPGIESLPDLLNLTTLSIYDCENLESLPDLSNLTLLQDLEITKCPRIDIGGVWPSKLRSLLIGGLKKPISEWGAQNFPTSLIYLDLLHEHHVNNFHHLSGLLPSSLTMLQIEDFKKLESLSRGLQHLTSLQHLEIRRCPKMKRLPESLLPSLLSLRIIECPDLEERCNGRGSKFHYWPLISHIPCIEFEEDE